MSKPPGYRKLAVEERKRKRKLRKEARRVAKRSGTIQAPAPTLSGAISTRSVQRRAAIDGPSNLIP